MRKLPKSQRRGKVVNPAVRLAISALDKYFKEINSKPCGWCTLPRGEHIGGPKGLGHPWISLEMDMLIRCKGIYFQPNHLAGKIK